MERTQPRALEHLPPREEVGEALVPDVHLDQQLPERQRAAAWCAVCLVRIWRDKVGNESAQHLELEALDVDVQDVNVRVAWRGRAGSRRMGDCGKKDRQTSANRTPDNACALTVCVHQAPQRPHLGLVRGPVAVRRAEAQTCKVRAGPQCSRNRAAEPARDIVIAPHLAVPRAREQLRLEARVPVEACGGGQREGGYADKEARRTGGEGRIDGGQHSDKGTRQRARRSAQSRMRRTERVDDAVGLLRKALEPADPLAAVAESTKALDGVRAVEDGWEEVPWRVRERCG